VANGKGRDVLTISGIHQSSNSADSPMHVERRGCINDWWGFALHFEKRFRALALQIASGRG